MEILAGPQTTSFARAMGKPLKAKQLNLSKGQRDRVLKWQGVKISKRVRLGHTGHFGKVDVVPIEGKPNKPTSENSKTEDSVLSPNLTGKLPGESYGKFLKRVGKETREALVQLDASKRKVNAKRKAYLDGRKDTLKERKSQIQRSQILEKVIRQEKDLKSKASEGLPLQETVQICFAALDSAKVAFGEQAERPPQIKMSKPLKGLKKKTDPNIGYVQGGVPGIPELSGQEKNRREFEMLRQNAVRSYREIMQKKREKKGMLSI